MIRHLEETNIAIGVLGVHFSVIDEKLYLEHLAFQASRDLELRTRSFLGLCITGQDGDGAYYENQLSLRLDLENFQSPNIVSFVLITYYQFLSRFLG